MSDTRAAEVGTAPALVSLIESPLTEAQLSDIESLARKSSEPGGSLKHLAPDAVLRLVAEVRALRAVLQSTRATITDVCASLDSEDAGERRAAIERVMAACEGASHPVLEPLSLERAVHALIALGWLPPESRHWAAGVIRGQLDHSGVGNV